MCYCRFFTAAFLIAFTPAYGFAQSLLCAWTNQADDGEDGQTPALLWMNGYYTIESVSTNDGSCEANTDGSNSFDCKQMLLGLDGFSVPRQAAYPEAGFFGDLFGGSGWTNTELGNRIRNSPDRGAMNIRWTRPRDTGGRMDGDMLADRTHIWCVNTDRGRTLLQASIARDLRWGPAGFFSAIGDLIGIGDSKEYIGPTPSGAKRDRSWTVPTGLRTTWGFPTAQWETLGPAQARLFDQRFRTTLEPRYAQNFTTWEFQLHGAIRREPAQYQVCAEREFELIPPRWVCVKYRWVKTFKYTRTLGGEARMTTYLSHRIGDGDYEPARFEYQFHVVLRGPDIFEPDSAKMERIADQLAEEFCGSRNGCGSIPTVAAAGAEPPFGMKLGTDSAAILQELCHGASMRYGSAWGIPAGSVDCFSEQNNPFLPSMDPTQAELQDAVTGSSIDIDAFVTRSDITRGRTGIRIMDDDTLKIASQAEFHCLRKAQRDSVDIVNGPREIGEPPPPPVPTDVLFNICAARMKVSPRPNAPTPQLDGNRCFAYNGSTYCIR